MDQKQNTGKIQLDSLDMLVVAGGVCVFGGEGGGGGGGGNGVCGGVVCVCVWGGGSGIDYQFIIQKRFLVSSQDHNCLSILLSFSVLAPLTRTCICLKRENALRNAKSNKKSSVDQSKKPYTSYLKRPVFSESVSLSLSLETLRMILILNFV